MATQAQPLVAQAIEARAMGRHVRMSPQKARLVIDLIRGRRAEDAVQILRFTKKRAAKPIEKILRSAIANAERKAEDARETLDIDQLYVSQCYVNEGPRWKRIRPAPMGRAFHYQKRTAHIVVHVAERHEAATERMQAAAAEAASQKGVAGAVKRVRKAVAGSKAPVRKSKSGGKGKGKK